LAVHIWQKFKTILIQLVSIQNVIYFISLHTEERKEAVYWFPFNWAKFDLDIIQTTRKIFLLQTSQLDTINK